MITSIQVAMIVGIAYIGGRSLDPQGVLEFLAAVGANVGMAFGLREAARALVKVVFPPIGDPVSGVIAAAGTTALGHAAIAYFIDGRPISEVKAAHRAAPAKL